MSGRAMATRAAGFGPASYGDAFADVYDDWYRDVSDAEATARFVADACGSGPVLELGVGTGRLVRPLEARGLTVVGLDASAAMLGRCRRSGAAAALVRADMANLPFAGRFGAVLIAFNTLFNLSTAAAQRSLFAQLGRLVADDGAVVVEAMNPGRLIQAGGRSVAVGHRDEHGLTVIGTEIEPEAQRITGQHVELGPSGARRRPWQLRWSWPEEIDRFAADAGLVLSSRHGDWDGHPFDASSETHVSLYRPAPG